MKVVVEAMALGDVIQVVEVDRECYPMPWPASAYRRELNSNHQARYIVLRDVADTSLPNFTPSDSRRSWRSILGLARSQEREQSLSRGRVLGYAGMWIVADEAHVTTIAVRAQHRGKGFGELLLASLVGMAFELNIRWITLEVRVSNDIARKLYVKYGFRESGLRKRYYSDNNEDALVMTTDDISLNAYQARFGQLCESLAARLAAILNLTAVAPVLAGRIRHASARMTSES